MTDTELVERLRNGRWIGGELIALEAADRIEALTHITGLAEQEHRRLQTQSDTAEAENTKLREALVATDNISLSNHMDAWREKYSQEIKDARAALSKGGG